MRTQKRFADQGCYIKEMRKIRPKTSKTASVLNYIETNKVTKESYLIRQYNIQIFDKIIFIKYRIRQIKVTSSCVISIKLRLELG